MLVRVQGIDSCYILSRQARRGCSGASRGSDHPASPGMDIATGQKRRLLGCADRRALRSRETIAKDGDHDALDRALIGLACADRDPR